MKYLFTLAIATISVLILGCKESYPSIYMEEEPVPDVIHAENDEDGRVPITPTMSEPQYDIITRGSGAFEPYEIDKEKWKQAKFHTYAFLGSNIFSRSDMVYGQIDYSNQDNPTKRDSTRCLLWDQIMKITNDDMNVQFFDSNDNRVTRYYNWQHQNWKYNFFTFYADDLDVSNAKASNKDIKVEFDIDGTQDIMHAVAYHTEEQFDTAVAKLIEGEDKPLHQYGNELLYSTMAGHRGLHPIFDINHLLTRLDFVIKGAKPASTSFASTSDSYRKIVVTKVTVSVPNHATLTIAKDDWADSTIYKTDLNNNNVITFSGTPRELPLIMNHEPASNYYTWLNNEPDYTNMFDDNTPQFHIDTTAIKSLGKPIMLPPSDMFVVTLSSVMLNISGDATKMSGNLVGRPDPKNPSDSIRIEPLNDISYNVRYSNGSFEAGNKYTVIISVYGVQNVEGTLTLNAWIGRDAGDFIGKEQGEYNPNGDHVVSVGDDDEEDNGQ